MNHAPHTFDPRDLQRPEAFEHPVTQIELRETHVSWVILTGETVYKIKKPVKFDFVDASTLQQRLHFCKEELRLNQRLAPELYQAVVPITMMNGHARVAGSGEPVEYAVQMQQFDTADELPALLLNGRVTAADIEKLADLLAQFHARAAVAAGGDSDLTKDMLHEVENNHRALAAIHPHPASDNAASAIERLAIWIREQAQQLEACFYSRERSGRVREGHGDLHAANVVRYQGLLIPFDCLEFDPRLRWIDVMSDLAFLIMDLMSQQHEDLAHSLLSRYLEHCGDYGGVRVLPFYLVHRALIRAKVDLLTAAQKPLQTDACRQQASNRIRWALRWTQPAKPILILMHGTSGSGKSWVSERLVSALPALRIRSDVERKRLAAASSLDSSSDGIGHRIYSDDFSARTYAHLAQCALHSLAAGWNVIVDAACLKASQRLLLRQAADRTGARHVLVSCHAQHEVLLARIAERARIGTDPSDADQSVLDSQLKTVEPICDDENLQVVLVDTAARDPVDQVLTAITALTTAMTARISP